MRTQHLPLPLLLFSILSCAINPVLSDGGWKSIHYHTYSLENVMREALMAINNPAELHSVVVGKFRDKSATEREYKLEVEAGDEDLSTYYLFHSLCRFATDNFDEKEYCEGDDNPYCICTLQDHKELFSLDPGVDAAPPAVI